MEHQEGLILLSGGRKGDVGVSLIRGNMPLVEQCVAFYEEHFPDRYFLELIRTGRQDEEAYLHAAVALAEARGLPVVATNDVRFLETGDFDAHEIRVAIHDGFTLDDPKRPRNYSPQQYMRSEGGDVRAVRRHPGSAGKQRRNRQALQRHRAAWRIFPAAVPDRRYDHGRFPRS